MILLEVEDVSKRFGGVVALSGVSFTVVQGEIFGLMGANGAGKTTLFSLIAGNQRPSAGKIRFAGARIDGLKPDQISRSGIARAFQIVRPFPGMTVLENVVIGCLFGAGRERSMARAAADAMGVLDEVGLAHRAHHLAASLTLVERKRLEIARALATRPRLMLLDEVMAGLTPTEISDALDMIRAIHRGRDLTLVVIEHVMRALMQLCGRILVLHHGAKIAEGAPEAVANDTQVIAAYLGSPRR